MKTTHESKNLALTLVGQGHDKQQDGRLTFDMRHVEPREEFLQRLYEAVECEVADRVFEAGDKVTSTAMLAMPDGSRVAGRKASKEQWAEAANEYVEDNLVRAGRVLLEAVQFLEAEYFCRRPRQECTCASPDDADDLAG